MFRVLSDLTIEQDWRLILLAGSVCLLASLAAASLLHFTSASRRLIAEAEDKLHERNVRLDAALNNMSQGLCMLNASAQIVLCNRRFLEIKGMTPKEFRRQGEARFGAAR